MNAAITILESWLSDLVHHRRPGPQWIGVLVTVLASAVPAIVIGHWEWVPIAWASGVVAVVGNWCLIKPVD